MMEDAYMSTAEWRRTNMKSYAAQFMYDSGIPDVVAQYAKENGMKEGTIIRAAIVEKLEREGYLNVGKYSGSHGSLHLAQK